MKQKKVLSLIRHLLSIAGGLLVSYGIGSETLFADITGIIITLTAFIWSIYDQTYTIGKLEALIRHILTFVGGFLTNKVILSPSNIELWVSAIIAILPILLGNFDKNWGDPAPVEE